MVYYIYLMSRLVYCASTDFEPLKWSYTDRLSYLWHVVDIVIGATINVLILEPNSGDLYMSHFWWSGTVWSVWCQMWAFADAWLEITSSCCQLWATRALSWAVGWWLCPLVACLDLLIFRKIQPWSDENRTSKTLHFSSYVRNTRFTNNLFLWRGCPMSYSLVQDVPSPCECSLPWRGLQGSMRYILKLRVQLNVRKI